MGKNTIPTRTCPRCGGSGTVISNPHGKVTEVACGTCSGTGRIYAG